MPCPMMPSPRNPILRGVGMMDLLGGLRTTSSICVAVEDLLCIDELGDLVGDSLGGDRGKLSSSRFVCASSCRKYQKIVV